MKLTKFWKRNRYTFGSRGGGGARGASSRTSTGNSAPLCQILKYVQGFDYLWILVGLFGAIVASMTWPALTVAYGETVNEFADYEKWLNANRENQTEWDREQKRQDFMSRVYIIAGSTAIVCITNIIGNFLSLYSFQMFSLRLTKTVKRLYFQAILRQEISWFDMQNSGEFASRITSDFKKFENAFNENLSLLSYNISSAIIHLGLAFVYGWKLTLIVLSIAPLMGIAAFITTKVQAYYTQKELKACSRASSVAEEAISAIRTVFAFNGQRKEANRYESQLKPAMIYGFKRNFVSGVGVAIHWTLIYCALALGIWFGVQLHVNNEPGYDVGSVTIIFWAVTSTGFSIGYSAPFYEAFQTGKTAAKSIFDVIERVSSIDSSKHFVGTCPDNYQAIIEFQDVHFAYPSRRDVKVLRGLNLRINSGERIALVGPSGCGKSTTIQLIQRFYDVDRGKVLLDGQDIRYLNVGWLRQQLGVVGQEPVLFDASIEENIRLGMPFNQMDQITLADVERAADAANAHDFIKKLPLGYQTHVGDRGTQLSGGQKQRIAIARALIGKPKILLLDEATSALDLASEQTVQLALDRASRNCTTVIIAHRLSTIMNADRIIYIDQGEVVEQGTHDALMAQRGRYYDLVQAQLVNNNSNETTREMTSEHDQIAQQLSDFTPIRTGSSGFRSFNSDISNVGNKLHPVVITDDLEPEQLKELEQFPLKRLGRLIWMDKTYFIIAFITALIYGLSTPIYALIFGEFVDIFVEDNDRDRIISRTLIITISYLALAAGILICCTTQIALFGIVGEKLTKRLRTMAYRAILRQNIPYFDDKSNSAGALCSRLSNDAANVQGATGLRVSMMCQAVSTVVFSIIMGLICNWRLLLVSMALMPLVAFASVISSSIYSNQAKKDSKTAEKASKTTIEVMNSIRTVVSLNKEEYFYLKLERYLLEHYLSTRIKCLMKSIMISISFGAPLFAYTIAFAYGGYLIGWGLLGTGNFFKIVESIIFGAVVVGQSAVLSADFAKAKLAATNIFKLIDNSPPGSFEDDDDQDAINNNNAHNNAHKDNGKMVGCRLEMNASKRKDRSAGDIAFRGVHFSYPSRPGSKVLNGLSFSAQRGQTVALVGTSGCGKSTSIQLLERFYECNDGQVYLDDNNIARVPVEWLRSQMSLVQQEPILFSYSIKENIAYGDNTRAVTDEQIQTAAVMANAHEFIAQLPKGYDTPVGAKGVCKLSGGQKQRIAIARALIRDPPILLLDEATSALDTESEQIVQRALDEASKNRTCLVIAHRLNTIVNSDKIVVIDKGQNVEEGTHLELVSRRGHYWRLYKNATEPQPNQ